MTISPGSRLGPYEILAPLGAGGMGEVWRAKDTRLDREVAIKVLPEGFAQNEQFRARFEREAKTISSLNHPNICTLHDVGEEDGLHYLVMELLDGESLADRLAKGPLPLDQVIRFGAQIADALGRAHRQGIVHRDLKPGNVVITKAGAKLLDFGLARPTSSIDSVSGLTDMQTEAKPLTAEGTILGTFQYMAPEQLEGVEADARTDIFALGAVLYEMATGNRAFDGKTKTSLIAAIVSSEPPPITEVRKMSPSMLDRIVRKCLEKEPDDRWQSAYDIASELSWIADEQDEVRAPTPRARTGWIATMGVGLVALVLGSAVTWWAGSNRVDTTSSSRLLQTSIEPPSVGGFAFIGDYAGTPVLSPDGTKIVFSVVGEAGVSQLWVKDLAVAEPRLIPGTDSAYVPFWSPDSQSIAFFDRINLLRVDLAGGAPRVLAPAAQGKGGSWSSEGVIIFSPNAQQPIQAVPATGGPVTEVTSRGERHSTHRWPHFLRDGKRFIYFAANHLDPFGPASEIRIASIEPGFEPRTIVASSSEGLVAAGRLLTLSGEDLVAYDFDEASATVREPSRPLGLAVLFDPTTWKAAFTASDNGMLAYVPVGAGGGFDVNWADRSGVFTASGLPAGNYMRVEISPTSAVAVFEVQYDQPNSDLWFADLNRGVRTRLTVSATDQVNPTWSSDGSLVYYGSNRVDGADESREASSTQGVYRVFHRRADGAGGETLIHGSDIDEFPWSVSRDGEWVLVAKGDYLERGLRELVVVSTDGVPPVWRLPGTEVGANDAQFSPDGRWVAYCSAPTGREEVYIVPFRPSSGGAGSVATGRWQISYSGGRAPRWAKDSSELFYVRGDNTLMSVPIELRTDTVVAGRETALFQTPLREDSVAYDVTRESDRFLVATLSATSRKPFAIVSGWPALLGR